MGGDDIQFEVTSPERAGAVLVGLGRQHRRTAPRWPGDVAPTAVTASRNRSPRRCTRSAPSSRSTPASPAARRTRPRPAARGPGRTSCSAIPAEAELAAKRPGRGPRTRRSPPRPGSPPATRPSRLGDRAAAPGGRGGTPRPAESITRRYPNEVEQRRRRGQLLRTTATVPRSSPRFGQVEIAAAVARSRALCTRRRDQSARAGAAE